MRLPDTWVEARLGDVLSRVETKVNPQTSSGTSHFYIGLEHIEAHTGRILRDPVDVTDASAILSVKTVFNAGDILYGKLRPNLNKVYLATQSGICSTDIWAMRSSASVLPDYAAYYLRSPAVHVRATQLATGANLPRLGGDAFDRMTFALPTLPEQQRIVDVLEQVKAVVQAKESISVQLDLLVKTIYWEHFGAWFTAEGLVDGVRIGDCVADSQYGVSEAMEGQGTHAVLRMNSITASGWLDLSDLKFADLSKKDIEATQLQDGDLLFNRTNSKELVGKCAIWRPAEGSFSFASYLVRLRLKSNMLPEYLWATLNSAYGKYRLTNAAKQAVSMANVSPTDLGRITVPLPPLALQERFAKLVRAIEAMRSQMLAKLDAFAELHAVVAQRALIGDLTATWREAHAADLALAASARDTLLRKGGATVPAVDAPVAEPLTQLARSEQTSRRWLHGELSEFQSLLLDVFTLYCQETRKPLCVEDPDVFDRFCDDSAVIEQLQAFGPSQGNRIRRALSQLAALGLIAKITLPNEDPTTQKWDYLKAFRPLRPEEFSRMADLRTLKAAIDSGTQEKSFFFSVLLDYESADRARLFDMFQVIWIKDDEENDFTHLVDQDNFYSSLDDLKADVAAALRVAVQQVDMKEV